MLPHDYLNNLVEADRIELWQRRLAQPNDRQYLLLAETEDVLAGFVCVLLDEEPAWGACLDNLHVRRDLAGRGLGRELFVRAAQWVKATEPPWPLHLWVFEANHDARRFYERLGGETVERVAKAMPGGSAPVTVRYVWRDMERLLESYHADKRI
jgi:GNAT superfamily N-acetyltransferase